MNKQKFLTQNDAPHLSIAQCHGDLVVRAWGETAVVAKGSDYDIEEGENSFSINSRGKLELRVPEQSHLSIQLVTGDTVIKFVQGDISLNNVHGDLVLSGIQSVKVYQVDNDLSAKHIEGAINVETVHGDVAVRHVGDVNLGVIQGDMSARYVNNAIRVKYIAGDLGLRSINGDIEVENAQRDITLRNIGGQLTAYSAGDIRLYGSLSAREHSLTADRDIILRWPSSAAVQLVAHAPQIKNRLPLDKVVENEDGLVGSIGDGQTHLTLKANGRIVLNEEQLVDARWEMPDENDYTFDFSFDLEGLGNQIREKFSEEMNRFSTEIESRLGPEFGQNLSERIAQKIEKAAAKAEQAATRAAQQAERSAERATARAERSAARARRQAEFTTRRSPGRPPGTGKSATPSSPPAATTEEKLKILKMVEQGIISPDEAATLLEALGR